MNNNSDLNAAVELRAEDARQLASAIGMLEHEIDLAETDNRLVTADRLRLVRDRLVRDFERVTGTSQPKSEPRGLDPVAAVLCLVFSLPLFLFSLLAVLFQAAVSLFRSAPVEAPGSTGQDVESAPVVAVPVAVPVPLLPAPPVPDQLLLPYYPAEPTAQPEAESVRKKAGRKPRVKAMPAVAQSTAETLFVKRGSRYVEVGKVEVQPGETLYRRVPRGKAVRYQAA